MRNRIVGLTGWAGSGKSSVAGILVGKYNFVRLRFAGPIKDMMRCLGLTDDEIDGSLKESPCKVLGGRTPRHAMQTLGTEWGRQMISPTLWVDVLKGAVERNAGKSIVIDDVRFNNETIAIRELGGILARVDRPGVTPGSHISEQGAFPVELVICNTSTLSDLVVAVTQLHDVEFNPDGSVT